LFGGISCYIIKVTSNSCFLKCRSRKECGEPSSWRDITFADELRLILFRTLWEANQGNRKIEELAVGNITGVEHATK
jgi:hypothetical protein